jgi:glycosyltransferase involved in cell wall biosynthesis
VRSLLVSSRFPWPPFTGDRLRALIWIDALTALGEVTLVSPPGVLPQEYEQIRHVPASRAAGTMASASAKVLRERLPFHSLIAAGRGWREALRRAGSGFDVAVVLLSRFEPWIRGSVAADRIILDAIDSLGRSMAERAREASFLSSVFWRREAARTSDLEEKLANRYDTVMVVSEEERVLFGPGAVAVPNGVEIDPLAGLGPRRYEFGFWGRLAYFANRDAATVLLDTIWPEIRKLRPQASLLIAGADAPSGVTARSGRDGITVISPMADRPALLRQIEVALFPIRFGTGQSNKLMEAGEAGCAVACTTRAIRGLDDLLPHAAVFDDPLDLARAAAAIDNPRERGRAAREAVENSYSREATLKRLRRIATGAPS